MAEPPPCRCRKVAYATHHEARRVLKRIVKRHCAGRNLEVYQCRGGMWHLGSSLPRVEKQHKTRQ